MYNKQRNNTKKKYIYIYIYIYIYNVCIRKICSLDLREDRSRHRRRRWAIHWDVGRSWAWIAWCCPSSSRGAVAIGSVAGTGDASPGCPTGRCGDIVLPVPRRDIGSERARGEWILLRSRCHVKRVLIREHSFNQPHMSKRSDDTAT